MLKLIILADDFTGALDTGVQFTKKGIRTLVTADLEWDFTQLVDFQVLVFDMESRHIRPEEAYSRVYQITKRAMAAGICNFYKKTDSGLRGNIGSELAAMVAAMGGGVLPFIPAYPAMDRKTRMGKHYIQGVPVSQSVYGADPFEPVLHDGVAEIIGEQTSVTVIEVRCEHLKSLDMTALSNCITVFDAESDEDFDQIQDLLANSGRVSITAGCAGFAARLPELLCIQPDVPLLFTPDKRMLVFSGSVNQITFEQIGYAAENGFPRITLTPEEKLADNLLELPHITQWVSELERVYQKEGRIIIDVAQNRNMLEQTEILAERKKLSTEDARQRIAQNMATLVNTFIQRGNQGTLIVFGGDTLYAILRALRCDGIIPLQEIGGGTVLSKTIVGQQTIFIISKSGGFGKKDVLNQIERVLHSAQ